MTPRRTPFALFALLASAAPAAAQAPPAGRPAGAVVVPTAAELAVLAGPDTPARDELARRLHGRTFRLTGAVRPAPGGGLRLSVPIFGPRPASWSVELRDVDPSRDPRLAAAADPRRRPGPVTVTGRAAFHDVRERIAPDYALPDELRDELRFRLPARFRDHFEGPGRPSGWALPVAADPSNEARFAGPEGWQARVELDARARGLITRTVVPVPGRLTDVRLVSPR